MLPAGRMSGSTSRSAMCSHLKIWIVNSALWRRSPTTMKSLCCPPIPCCGLTGAGSGRRISWIFCWNPDREGFTKPEDALTPSGLARYAPPCGSPCGPHGGAGQPPRYAGIRRAADTAPSVIPPAHPRTAFSPSRRDIPPSPLRRGGCC